MALIFLKLGGSLITDKNQPYTVKLDLIRDIGKQIKRALSDNKDMKILIGHGSGSFGHAAAKASNYIEGDRKYFISHSFQKIWVAAHQLNTVLVDEFNQIGLPVVSMPPSSSISSNRKKIINWNIKPLELALEEGLVPVIFGDAVLDIDFGGVIYSTEDLFLFLIDYLHPEGILLAGKEDGIWADFPERKKLISKLSDENFPQFESSINSSLSVDVTGGMLQKVQLMMSARKISPDMKIMIFSGENPDSIYKSLSGILLGTSIL